MPSSQWRAFLFLWTILMHPLLPYEEHLRIGFALYSSAGALELECRDKISIAAVKDLICTLVLLTLRPEIRHNIDTAWV